MEEMEKKGDSFGAGLLREKRRAWERERRENECEMGFGLRFVFI